MNRLIIPALLLTSLLAGCLSEGSAPAPDLPAESRAPEPRVLKITALDFGYELPDRVPAGWTLVEMKLAGESMHHASIYRLPEGKTLDDVKAAMTEFGHAAPRWLTAVGGPNVPMPGETARAYVDLQPGRHVVLCLVPGPDGRPHAVMGNLAEFLVVPADTPATPVPEPTSTLRLRSFAFVFDEPPVAGTNVIRVINEAQHDHEISFFRLMGNATAQDIPAWFMDPQGPPPFAPVGGAAPMDGGKENTIKLDLEPGRYAVLCFEVDGTDHDEPHFIVGMIDEFSVA